MVDYTKRFGDMGGADAAVGVTAVTSVFRQVYGWMCAGLAVSAAVAWYTAVSGLYMHILTGPGPIVCIVAELALVFFLGAKAMKLSPGAAILTFLLFAAVNGLTLSTVLLVYGTDVIAKTFLVTAGMFGGLAVYGTVTKSDLSGIGSICSMGLWGIILMAVIHLFFPFSSGVEAIITIIGIVVFCGLTMYDSQRIRLLSESAITGADVTRVGILGALTLYLDFVNLFLYLLRFMGNRSRD